MCVLAIETFEMGPSAYCFYARRVSVRGEPIINCHVTNMADHYRKTNVSRVKVQKKSDYDKSRNYPKKLSSQNQITMHFVMVH